MAAKRFANPAATRPRRNGEVSFWYASACLPTPRDPLPGDRTADVCIVGAGFTGLWTAYELKRAKPELDVVVLDAEFAGFGASGRNGGWLSSGFAASRAAIARSHGRAGVLALEHALRVAIEEVIAVAERERIDADIVRSGVLRVARNPAQLRRLRAQLVDARAWGIGQEQLIELDAATLAGRLRVAGALGATWTRHGARVQPARLVRGLAAAVERLGVPIHERTAVRAIEPGVAVTDQGVVRADRVLCCLEGFTAGLPGQRRTWIPLNSAMVMTEPLPDALWEQIGWQGAELLGDAAHAYIYAQRTADGRIALGGRGVPYRYGSRWDERGRTQPRTVAQLVRTLHELFPAVASAAIDHAWCGVLGVPRDWSPTVRLDPATGLGIAGGYVGHGVATSNLAARCATSCSAATPS